MSLYMLVRESYNNQRIACTTPGEGREWSGNESEGGYSNTCVQSSYRQVHCGLLY